MERFKDVVVFWVWVVSCLLIYFWVSFIFIMKELVNIKIKKMVKFVFNWVDSFIIFFYFCILCGLVVLLCCFIFLLGYYFLICGLFLLFL